MKKCGRDKKMHSRLYAVAIGGVLLSASTMVFAQNVVEPIPLSEKEVRQLQIKTQTLINVLVKKGLIDAETARALSLHAEQEAAKEFGAATDVVPHSQKDTLKKSEAGVVRVPYIPKQLQEQIRNQVSDELEQQVVDAVLKKANEERWGVPNSWPAWVNAITLSGDIRSRYESINFAEDNSAQLIDVIAINRAGGTIPAGPSAYFNTTEDVDRLVVRARLGIDMAASPNWNMGFRFSTGRANNPVSGDLTLSDNMSNGSIFLNRAFVNYHTTEKQFQLWTGKFANPWLSTDLVWDEDVSFSGIAATYAPLRNWIEDKDDNGFDPFVTAGVFPLDEIAITSKDKWLYGAQTGFNYLWENKNILKIGIAIYDYKNIEGQFNTFGSDLLDYTAPDFAQKGNALFDIRNDADEDSQLGALASDYNELNITASYDLAYFNPIHIVFIADYVENIGFNARENLENFSQATGVNFNEDNIQENVDGYKFEVVVGHASINKLHDWNASIAYKSLESDAVLDAFTDSTFHLGGTDGAGYIASIKYGVAKNTWLTLRTLSSNEINGAPLGVDIWQVDLMMKL